MVASPTRTLTARPTADRDAQSGPIRRLLERILPEPRQLTVRLWDGTTLPANEEPARATLELRDPSAVSAMLTPPLDLAAGEAFVHGDVEVEGDLEAVFDAIEGLDWRAVLRASPGVVLDIAALRRRSATRKPIAARLRGRRHTRTRDRHAIQHHYDVSNDFYRSWLDERLVYSCAYFATGGETLGEAQEAKLDLVCRKLRLREGERLLDIGCGWGALVLHAAQRYGVSAVGVTLSTAQLDEARRRVEAAGLTDRVRIELLDYRDVSGLFDKVASIGMAEHVGREKLGAYFRSAWGRLAPGGLMLNHAISRGPRGDDGHDGVITGEFTRRYVFPDGEILPLWRTLQTAEEVGFEVRDVEDLREHYATTLRHWVRNLEAAWPEASAEVGQERARIWRLFMSGAAHQFKVGRLALHQTLLAKTDGHGHVSLPPSRADLYG